MWLGGRGVQGRETAHREVRGQETRAQQGSEGRCGVRRTGDKRGVKGGAGSGNPRTKGWASGRVKLSFDWASLPVRIQVFQAVSTSCLLADERGGRPLLLMLLRGRDEKGGSDYPA